MADPDFTLPAMKKLTLLLAFLVLVAGCGGGENTQPSPGSTASQGQASTPGVGDAISLNTVDTNILIRLNKVIDPVKGGKFDMAPASTRFVGIEMTIKNAGDETFSGSLYPAIELVGDDDRVAQIGSLSEGPCSGAFATGVEIGPGDRRAGCVVFTLDKSSDPRLFQFSVDSGEADPNTGEWSLG